ncbi:hypothetical protein VF14_03460 [Nostoc linckia z18]|uniref:Uncharacterized protein n=2 Tax=Nostoc linckia TaxID=92942 RepID=A0A9Q5ZH04_NOSLI|nr:hypothetical protein [Nostoc linckia]PHK41438.1 hypothetical protein VF12_06440 [Nostoc linckia z15]PHK46939.1 hypothetical protein VF13_08100 [Nostoc linckia z16]PHJ69201.1 hypothetical protein VF02_00930 [Nostoc linckia z1]PHJ73352.1 hypothetical protein VF05_01945 [Nostoc linckia z3]PHJ78699.1 hypothetical protein VF03_00930 [Nostoc linckia z2]
MNKSIFGIAICLLLANTPISLAQDVPHPHGVVSTIARQASKPPTRCRGCGRREPKQLVPSLLVIRQTTPAEFWRNYEPNSKV